jgi:hypothetical protein
MKVKIHILFYCENSRTVVLPFRHIKYDTVKDHGHTHRFHLNGYFV